MIERRSAQRFKKEISVSFSDGNKRCSGFSADFSASGVFIITREPFRPGTPIELVLYVSHSININLEGTVARSIRTGITGVRDGMGIKLNSVPFSYHNFLRELEEDSRYDDSDIR